MAAFARFLDPPRLRTTETARDRRATWLELFFDLVFVVAIAELGTVFSLHVSAEGFFKYVGLFLVVCWAWSGFAFYANRFDTDDLVYRLLVLVGMFGVAALATNIREAFLHGAAAFALWYAAVRIVLLILYARAMRSVPAGRRLATWYFADFAAAVVVWVVSTAFHGSTRYVLWGIALAIELAAPLVGWRLLPDAPVDVTHMPERFGLLTIIVLGESVLAVVVGVRYVTWGLDAAAVATGGFVAAAAIWWIYFDFLDASMVSRSLASGLVYVYAHLPVVIGIAAAGVGVKLAILSTGDSHHGGNLWVACVGTAICMAGLAAIQLATPPVLFDADVWLRLGTAALAIVLAAVSSELSPVFVVWLLAAALVLQVVVELRGHEQHSHAGEARGSPS